jgi:NAD(P)-dependent dehydrogenase (short-subunit alcohol dehydrogenase family)
MTEDTLVGQTAIVVGASRGFGRGIAEAFVAAGAKVVAVGRDAVALAKLAHRQPAVQVEIADAADPSTAGRVLGRYPGGILALVAGATPVHRPLHLQTWETFSTNWHADVQIAFHWVREALLIPLRPGSVVIVMSSGAAMQGSPLSGGYAGAKATVRFITAYAAQESDRAGLGITFKAVLPKLSPATDLGRTAVAAYAARAGVSEDRYGADLGPPATPEIAGSAFVRLALLKAGDESREFLLTGAGLQPVVAPATVPR